MASTDQRTSERLDAPRRRDVWALPAAAVLAGFALAVLWSYEFVDHVIGGGVMDMFLDGEVVSATSGVGAGLIFAFVSGLAATFTACNVAAAACVAPIARARADASVPVSGRALLRPLGVFLAGMLSVSAGYGVVGVLLGERLPQLSTAMIGEMPVRLLQSSVVFTAVGLVLLYLGLASVGIVRDVFAGRDNARVLLLGTLVGAFLIGRPFPLFMALFSWAAENRSPLLGAAAFVLQSVGNVVVMVVLVAVVSWLSRGRLLQWLGSDHRRAARISGFLLLMLGAFSVVYWAFRVPAIFGVGWFPQMPYN